MHAWHRGQEFLRLLARKQDLAKHERAKIDKRLAEIEHEIRHRQCEYDDLAEQILQVMGKGVISRGEIYQCIRRQGVLLSLQQDVVQVMHDLQQEHARQLEKRQQCLDALTLLDKRHYKISGYLQRMRRELLRQVDMSAESEIQERAGYGSKNN